MDSIEIKQMAHSMVKEIKAVIDAYNRFDPDISYFPYINMLETETTEGVIKGFSVEVEVSYKTGRSETNRRQFTQTDTSTNAYMEGKKDA